MRLLIVAALMLSTAHAEEYPIIIPTRVDRIVPTVVHKPSEPTHSHTCQRCKTVWSHGNSSHGDVNAHKCPSCGSVQWMKDVRVEVRVQGCPGGVCPTVPQRRLLFKWR